MNRTIRTGLCIWLSVASAALAQRRQAQIPAGTHVHRDLAYVENGHERQKLDLYLPAKADSPLPLIVWVHPGAWLFGSKDDGGPAVSFVGDGYAVASINYRLSQHATFPAQIEDCKAAIRWLRANAKAYNLDADCIAVWGASSGGHLVALLGTSGDVKELEGKEGPLNESSRVQAVVDWFGPTDVTRMGGGHDEPDSPESRLLGGPVQENKDKAAKANPITYASMDDPAFLILHGDQDNMVPFNQSELLFDALKQAGVDVTFRPVQKAGHGGPQFASEDNRELVAAFLAKHLKNVDDSKRSADANSRKQQVINLLKSIETGAPEPVAVINPKKYIQHNLAVADGIEGFGSVLKLLPPGTSKVHTVRVFEDGNYVFAHTDYNFFGPKIGFDIFRFEDGRIVEHWDNLQEKPDVENPSGHSMIDGPTDAKDLDKTEANKLLVRQFVEDILVSGKLEQLAGYFGGDNYVQHNPQIGDGLSGLGKALESMAKAGVVMKYDEVHHVFGEGNFVLVVSEGQFAGKLTSFYDLFRVEQGKIAEHWDTMETIPAKTEWKNSNGKF